MILSDQVPVHIYGMILIINPDNDWYEVIGYVHNKAIYFHIYPITYDVLVQMLLPNHVLVHVRDENNNVILLPYVPTFYSTFVIKGMINISGYE